VFRIDLEYKGNYAGIGWSNDPIYKLDDKLVNGNVTEVGTREDLVAALQNNMLTVAELELV
jgi:hypothetical protein